MSRRTKSWLRALIERDGQPSPLIAARVERRLRTEADGARAVAPTGLARRTLNVVQQIEPDGGAAVLPFRRRPPALSSLSLAALLVLAGLISQRLSGPASPAETADLSRTMAIPSARALQAKAEESIRVIERRTGIDFDRPEVADPLMTEVRAMWRDAERAADAILASMPRRYLSDQVGTGRSG